MINNRLLWQDGIPIFDFKALLTHHCWLTVNIYMATVDDDFILQSFSQEDHGESAYI